MWDVLGSQATRSDDGSHLTDCPTWRCWPVLDAGGYQDGGHPIRHIVNEINSLSTMPLPTHFVPQNREGRPKGGRVVSGQAPVGLVAFSFGGTKER
jgi:hypothetical protein